MFVNCVYLTLSLVCFSVLGPRKASSFSHRNGVKTPVQARNHDLAQESKPKELPGSPVFKTQHLHFHCHGAGFKPGWGTKMLWDTAKKKKLFLIQIFRLKKKKTNHCIQFICPPSPGGSSNPFTLHPNTQPRSWIFYPYSSSKGVLSLLNTVILLLL